MLFLWEVFGIFDMTLLYSAKQRLVVLHNSTSSRHPFKVTPDVVCKIRRWISKINPPTKRKKALDTGMSKRTVYYIIRHVVKAKLLKKFKAHQLNMAQIQKRRARSWKLYI
ncbi:hypothetical protein DPMN_155409 [Dreissena polymorpha]|uniref:Uncharacterized protein n=1 Tax=Dreissena polymorpha TaxID=45954 RepID=A0A9D4FR52_DREPO|nr:hypothetical protein DPMN_155409 [Dreissena polymorpha]